MPDADGPTATSGEPNDWPRGLHAIAALGDECGQLARQLHAEGTSGPVGRVTDAYMLDLSAALHELYDEQQRAPVIRAVFDRIRAGKKVDLLRLRRWLRAHVDQPDEVVECLNIDPPAGIEIERLLSRKGSQKLVFLSDWQAQLRLVVLKKFLEVDDIDRLIERETLTFPLTIRHDNIVETYLMENEARESFLVEEYLQVRGDDWAASGTEEAANVLSDIGSALAYLHDHRGGYVHGDVKPDNIGVREGRFVLLDFGVARPAEDFSEHSTATGSLRTRAPELFLGNLGDPRKLDVWALGATVFKLVKHRYPFLELDEDVPRIWETAERERKIAVIKQRIEGEWDRWLDLSDIDEALRAVLEGMLHRDATERHDAEGVLRAASGHLRAYIRNPPQLGGLSPLDEANQLVRYLTPLISGGVLAGMPTERVEDLRDRLEELSDLPACQHLAGKLGVLLEALPTGEAGA